MHLDGKLQGCSSTSLNTQLEAMYWWTWRLWSSESGDILGVSVVLNAKNEYNIYWTTYNCQAKILFLSSFYPKTQPLHLLGRDLKSTHSQRPLPDVHLSITSGRNRITCWKILWMVTTQQTNSNVPGNHDCLNAWHSIPQCRCGLDAAHPIEKITCWRFRHSSGVRIEIVSTCVEVCKAWSGWWIKHGIIVEKMQFLIKCQDCHRCFDCWLWIGEWACALHCQSNTISL